MSEKLQKVLARAGLGSRREIEQWIEDGRLMVNGYPALLGTRVEPKDEVKLDGRRLKLVPEALVNRKVLMYHKPEGEVTTRKDPEGRPTVFDRLPPMRGSRWVVIGRLDLNTSGLLLFTNDGEMANRLMHPSHEVEREYAVRILGELKPAQRKALLEGVVLEDGLAKFNSIESRGGGGSNRWYHVTLSEGRTREVRRMFESLDLVVSRLIRVRYGPVALDPLLKQGMNRLLNAEEMDRLCEAVGIEPQAPRAERRREYQHTRRSEPMTGRGPAAAHDDEFDDEDDVAPRASTRKAKVIGSKDDDLPLDRVERAAELLRRRRAAESAGVDFSGRNRRLSGKRTLRESELRRIAEEKAAAKKREAGETAGSAGKRTRAGGEGATSARARSSAAAGTGSTRSSSSRSTVRSTTRTESARGATTRSATTRTATTRSASTRTGTSTRAAPSRARFDRDDDDMAPRRSTRTSARPSRASDDEAPRQRSASRTGTRSTAKPAGKFASSERGERSASGTGRTRSSAASADRSSLGSKPASAARTGSRTTSKTGGARANAAGGSRGTGSGRSAKPASRSAAAKPARSSAGKSAKPASGARSAGRTGSSGAKPSRAGSSGRTGARPGAGKGKR